ncbi:MoxR family ATPase [Brachybacterium huguangmaarense]|uniref:MoxR family ATPase n=1 Tax=Brachybacterium huguangmaarense TaxID=1652028 RepID=A0ABY6G232_9MICO|nr:MoxR family ATPase [Brachybacterium huguangmaarense]UYG17264.1 MoxR family ATPase [Brachybacterium huguangmaarense]
MTLSPTSRHSAPEPDAPTPGHLATPPTLDTPAAEAIATTVRRVTDEVATVVEGKREAIELTVLVLLAGGHLLVEDVPGVGKTILAKSLAAALGAGRRRIQFTPDLLPGDITGASIFNQVTRDFEFRPGAVFTNVLLADEINRASPKTQSALLEAMEERQVTVDGATYGLEEPFMVIATANPVEMEGTYRLPEAQRDRFTAQISLGYPVPDAEARMLAHQGGPVRPGAREIVDEITAVTEPATIASAIQAVRTLHADPSLFDYVVRLARATREHPRIALGASPRAGVHLVRAAKAHAVADGRTWLQPEDVRAVIDPVWRHRLHLTPQALSRGSHASEILHEVLDSVAVRA